jgi:hypothetical protein
MLSPDSTIYRPDSFDYAAFSLFHQLGDLSELRVFGGSEQLEEGHFHAADVGALRG